MTPAQFLAMLDAATPEELREIARRIAPLVLNFPLAELPADAIGAGLEGGMGTSGIYMDKNGVFHCR